MGELGDNDLNADKNLDQKRKICIENIELNDEDASTDVDEKSQTMTPAEAQKK